MRPDRYNADPTPFEAFKNMERRPIVYICSREADVESARRYCRFAVATGYLPIAPHLLFSQFMDADELDPA